MIVGMVSIGRLFCHFEANPADDAGSGVREVIYSIGSNGNMVGYGFGKKFAEEQKGVADNADFPRKFPVDYPGTGRLRSFHSP